MKHHKTLCKTLFALLLVGMLGSCGSFLEEVSNDQIVPKSVEDYSQLLFGEAYVRDLSSKSIHTFLDVMTDDVKSDFRSRGSGANATPQAYGYFAWQKEPEISMTGAVATDQAWFTYYRMILFANITLNELDKLIGKEEDRIYLKGECHAIRAYAYFMLINLYAQPYEQATAASTPGVPINNLVSTEDVKIPRAKLSENYALIIDNLNQAIEAFNATPKKAGIFRWNLRATELLASRVHLYMKEYDKAIEHATKLLELSPQLYNLERKKKEDASSAFLNSQNPEILFSYGSYFIPYFAAGARAGFPVSDNLMGAYSTGDCRYNLKDGAFIRRIGFFISNRKIVPCKNEDPGISQVFGFALRTAEAYLNRAEAYAEKGEIAQAMADLNTLRRHRFLAANYRELNAATKEEAVELVRKERRLELCFEQHRWFDLRRWDRPEITHVFIVNDTPLATQTFVLKKDDPAYTLPIPISVTENDSQLADTNNERPDREAI